MRQFHMKNTWVGIGLIALATLAVQPARPQTMDQQAQPAEFTAESAIVDTAIPFAIGASEARQSLRGAFGWPTFQEGLVEGVYFRFDPDGYARFSPNPRLDVDVFEVLCKARTKDCHARKAGLTVILTPRGQLQLALEGVIAGDSFFLSEGVSEIQVPERVLQPLDIQMENLLSSSLELVVRRGSEEVSRHSLRGFLAATAYLRWIANNQDYAVLPRDWPVPNGRQVNAGQRMIQNANWQSPMPQPQVIAITPAPAPLPQVDTDGIDAQLKDLREALQQVRMDSGVDDVSNPQETRDQTVRMEAMLADLSKQVQALRETTMAPASVPSGMPDFPVDASLAVPVVNEAQTVTRPTEKLAYLVEELGLDLRSAVAVLELAENADRSTENLTDTLQTSFDQTSLEQAAERFNLNEDVVLAEQGSAQALPVPDNSGLPAAVQPVVTVEDYMLLSDYFRSAILPALIAAPPSQ